MSAALETRVLAVALQAAEGAHAEPNRPLLAATETLLDAARRAAWIVDDIETLATAIDVLQSAQASLHVTLAHPGATLKTPRRRWWRR